MGGLLKLSVPTPRLPLLYALIITILASSCVIEKRLYRTGYYIQCHRAAKQDSLATESVSLADPAKTQDRPILKANRDLLHPDRLVDSFRSTFNKTSSYDDNGKLTDGVINPPPDTVKTRKSRSVLWGTAGVGLIIASRLILFNTGGNFMFFLGLTIFLLGLIAIALTVINVIRTLRRNKSATQKEKWWVVMIASLLAITGIILAFLIGNYYLADIVMAIF